MDKILAQNIALQKQIEVSAKEMEELKEKLESCRNLTEETDRECNEEIIDGRRISRKNNKITIAVPDHNDMKADKNRLECSTKVSFKKDDNRYHRKKKITKIDIGNAENSYMLDEIGNKNLFIEKRRPNPLNRCKSFLGLRRECSQLEVNMPLQGSALVLKSDIGNYKVKRSKSMDIFKRNLFNPGRREQSMVAADQSLQKSKFEYVKRWQQDSLQFDPNRHPANINGNKNINNNLLNKNKTFYSLYF